MRRFGPYGVALLSVGAAILLRFAMTPAAAARTPFVTFFVATLVAGWVGGLGPGALALATGLIANRILFGPPDQPRAFIYLVVCSIIVVIYGSLRSAKDRAEEAHRRALAAVEDARERAAFLADGNVRLTASLDYDETLANLASLLVPRLADWCAVDVIEPDGAIRRAVSRHGNPAKADLARATATYTPDPDARHPRTEVLRTGRSQLVVNVTDRWLAAIAADAEHLRVMRQLGYVSGMIVPLCARGRTLGAISCAITESARRYTRDDLVLVEDVATRAAIALDNARLYREAEVARSHAQEANQAKDEFLSVVSHELKTPLASTLGWLRVLRSATSERNERALDTMERSVRVQAKLIDDLLDISRMAAGRLRLDLVPVELARIVETATDTIRPEAEAKGVQLEVTVGAPTMQIVGDPDRLRQIVWNLVSNAVKFTPASGRILVRLAQDDSRAELVVEDTGRGIDDGFLPHVFERFRQAEPISSRHKGGLGIGLAIARHLVELHGGTIAVASAGDGKGATFTVRLPLSPSAVTAASRDARGSALDRRGIL